MSIVRHGLAAVLVLLSLSLAPTALADDEPQAPTPSVPLEMREFHLQHIDCKEANAIIRSLLDVRKTAIDEQRQRIIVRDTPATVAAATRLVAVIDVPMPAWRARLVAVSGTRDVVLREIELNGEIDTLQMGGTSPPAAGDGFALRVTAARVAETEVIVQWTMSLGIPERAGREPWTEGVESRDTLHDGDEIVLLQPLDPTRRSLLAHLLGLEGEVSALKLKVVPEHHR